MDNPAVRLSQVSKFYNKTLALDCIDLEIRRGELFSLLGPSGCGKTTTLRLIAGFEEPSSGLVEIAGKSVVGKPAYQRDVNTVFQSYSLFPHLSVSENVAFGLRRKGCAESDIAVRVRDALEMVQMTHLSSRKPKELSGGQQQRVALARALINRPQVLLLDEPMAALDSKLRKEMRSELKRLQRESGITFVLVTHDQEEALTLSDRLAVVNLGRIEQVCSPREIYDYPKTRFVASFIGTANFLPVRVDQIVNGRTRVETQGGALWVPSKSELNPGDRADLTVRPERIGLSRTASGVPIQGTDERNAIHGKIVETSFMGPVTRYQVDLGAGVSLVAERQSSFLEEVGVGDEVEVSWEIQSGSLLDPAKEEATALSAPPPRIATPTWTTSAASPPGGT